MTETLVPGIGGAVITAGVRVVDHPAWPELKAAVEEIRPWQSADGSLVFGAAGAPPPDAPLGPGVRGVGAVQSREA
ncbi:hypothetical protein ACFXA9_20515, partial [Streptomyces sp. NPDC059411]